MRKKQLRRRIEFRLTESTVFEQDSNKATLACSATFLSISRLIL